MKKFFRVHIWECDGKFYIRKFGLVCWLYLDRERYYWRIWDSGKYYSYYKSLNEAKGRVLFFKPKIHWL